MTFFLLGYAIGLKENIKSVMRTFMIATCLFVFYTSAANAQTLTTGEVMTGTTIQSGSTNTGTIVPEVTVQAVSMVAIPVIEKSDSEIVDTMNRLVAMQKQTKWQNSSAFSKGNLAFFEGFIKQLALIPASDHQRMLTYTIEQLGKLTQADAKKKYSIEKDIVISVFKGIVEMAKNDSQGDTQKSDSPTKQSSSTTSSNALYTVTTSKVNGVTYTLYTLKKPQTIKYADFQDEHGSFIHCMYEQCNRISFTDRLPKMLQVQYILGEKVEFFDLTKSPLPSKIEENTNTVLQPKKSVSTQTSSPVSTENTVNDGENVGSNAATDDDLLKEISDIFGGIL